MSVTSILQGGSVCCILLLAISCGPASGPVGPARETNAKPMRVDGKQAKALAKMIDALANRNRPPKLVPIEENGPRLPLFPANYDWKEHERVRTALGKVQREKTPEMWEE